jgi:hypothetical protein
MRVKMTTIRVNKGGKQGPSCSWSIDPASGCNNSCISCYSTKASRQGKAKHSIEKEKEYNDKEFLSSIKSARKKGMEVCRVGKFCDPGSALSIGKTDRVLNATTNEGIRCVTISKSIGRTRLLLNHFKPKGHVLHISCGMLCGIRNEDRMATYRWFKNNGANVRLRITDDITAEMNPMYRGLNKDDVIVTPLRFTSRKEAILYNADLSKYIFDKGYWRPMVMHPSWTPYTNLCGTLGGRDFCCNCLVDNGDENV